MKKIILLLLFFTSYNSVAQNPDILIDEEIIRKNKISELYVIQDSVGVGYKPKNDTLKHIKFNKFGKKIYESWYRPDVNYHFIQRIYNYYPDSLRITEIDSSYGGPAFLREVGKSYTSKKYQNNKLIQVKEYPFYSNNKLSSTTNYDYNNIGLIKLETTNHESKGLGSSKYTSTIEHFYNDKNKLSKITETVYKSSKEVNFQLSTFYTYEENKIIITYEDEEFPGTGFGEKWTEDEVIFYNNKNQKIRKIKYDRNKKLRSTTLYNYQKNGLVTNEIFYYFEDDFAYRLRYKYIKNK